MPFANPPDGALLELLRRVRTVAVVGASPDPARPSHGVMRAMQRSGYRCFPVRPGGGEVLGEKVLSSLREVPGPVDLVDVFRAPEHVPGVVEEAIAAGARAIWLQEGVVHEAAAERARAAGLTVVMDLCVAKELVRLLPGGRRPA